jgi:hypothetical protein
VPSYKEPKRATAYEGFGQPGLPGTQREEKEKKGVKNLLRYYTPKKVPDTFSAPPVPLRCIAFRYNAGFATHWAVLPFVRAG